MNAREFYAQRVVSVDDAEQLHAYTIRQIVRGLLGELRAALTDESGLECACRPDGVSGTDREECAVHNGATLNRLLAHRALEVVERWEVR